MCGRYSETRLFPELKERFKLDRIDGLFSPRYNVAPTQDAPVIVNDGERILKLMRWGLIPFWAKEEAIGNRMINARAETLQEKPAFKRPFQRQRCLVVADGFYEWQKIGRGKQPLSLFDEGRPAVYVRGFVGQMEETKWRRPSHVHDHHDHAE